MRHRLLILGSLTEFVLITRMAKERGIFTVVCDANENGPAKAIADRAYHINVEKTDEIADICKREKIDGIITSFSDRLFECMVQIAAKAELKCYLTPDKLDYYRNKIIMKDMLTQLKISTPSYRSLRPDFRIQDLEDIQFPVVAKPVDKYGSRGIFVLNHPEEIPRYFHEICKTSEIKEILIEEYNPGYEFNMMSWVLDGKVHVISIADREKTEISPGRIPISTRNVYPSRLMEDVYAEASSILQKVVSYTQQKEGALSMQFFWKPGEPVQVCEIAGRFFGYEHELVEYSSGLSIEKLLLDYVYDETSLRRDLSAHSPWFSRCSAVLYFHGRETDIMDESEAVSLSKEEDIENSILFYKEGERISSEPPRPYVARYYLTGDTREAVDKRTKEIFHKMTIKNTAGEEVLYRNRVPKYPAE